MAKKPEPKADKVNTHYAAVYLLDGRAVEPGQSIPEDATQEDRDNLAATGYFQ
jgi:predicted alpha/beta superfamily hydrolase